MTEGFVSVDEPSKFLIYYIVGGTFRRRRHRGQEGACHSICWMAPFMVCRMALDPRQGASAAHNTGS